MNSVHEIDGIEYGICGKSDVEEMIKLLAYNFSKYDPPPVALGIDETEFADFVRFVSQNAHLDGLTIIARSKDTGVMAGVALNEDSFAPPPEEINVITRKFDPIIAMLEEMNNKYWKGLDLVAGSHFHIFLLGEDENFTGKKIAKNLVEVSMHLAATRGFQTIVTEATNGISQHIFRQMGFKDKVRGSYISDLQEGLFSNRLRTTKVPS